MAKAGRYVEGWPFTLMLGGLVLGSVWNAAGGNLDAFGRIWGVIAQAPPTDASALGSRLEDLAGIPKPVGFPPQKILPPKEIDQASKAMDQLPGPRPALAKLGARKKNPFFPDWAEAMARESETPLVVNVKPDPGKQTPFVAKTGKDEDDFYVFTGIVKLKDDPPIAVLRDVRKKVSVFLKEGDSYGQIRALKVNLGAATFQVAGKTQYSFDTLHSTNKTFSIKRYSSK